MLKRYFGRLDHSGKQALILVGGNGMFWFAWAFGCYQAVYLQETGFSASSVGVLNAISSVVGIASVSFWGMASDRIGSLRKILMIVLAGGATLYGLVPLIPAGAGVSPLFLMAYLPLVNFFRASMSPYAENILVRNCNELGLNFGVLRSIGSFLFTVGSLIIAAWLPSLGVPNTFWVSGLMMLIPLALTFFARDPKAAPKESGGESQNADPGKKSMAMSELIQNKAYVSFLLFGFLFYIAAACEGNFLPYYMEQVGISSQRYGIILAYRALLEIPCLLLMVKLRRRYPLRMLVLGAVALMSIECLGFGWLTKSLPTMLLFCTFVGLGNGLFLGSSLNYIYELAPSHLKASAQAFFTSTASVAGILGNLLGGMVFDAIGAKPFYLAVGCVYLLSAGVFLLSFRHKAQGAGQN